MKIYRNGTIFQSQTLEIYEIRLAVNSDDNERN